MIQKYKNITGHNNTLKIGRNLRSGILHVIIKGNNNRVTIGDDCCLNGENWIYITEDNNSLTIGNNVSFDDDVHFIQAEGTSIKVGDNCMFAKHINFRTSDQHGIFNESNERVNIAKDVNIGNHVWIGASVIVMKGVSIGNDSMIGIQSMVTKDIPNNCVAAGHPARVFKENIHWTRDL